MKKLFPLIISCFFVFIFSCAFAQENDFLSPNSDPEKIYLFDAKIFVQTDGKIKVVENITLNSRNQQIRRGIYRDLPVSLTEKVTPISLTMDGIQHPFFTGKKGHNLRINFGDNKYISPGRHTYSFTYIYTGAIDFFKDYDELYWNITGNDWNFTIDKARVQVILPPNTRVQLEGLSLYTGPKGSKDRYARQIGNLTFETTQKLFPGQGFTISVPFDKGIVQRPSLSEVLKDSFSTSVLISLILFIIFALYGMSTWLVIGRDPAYLKFPLYEPPKDISPAFTYYLYNETVNSKLLACAILDLAMKGYIEIQTKPVGFLCPQITTLKRKKTEMENLPYEEDYIMRKLFDNKELFTLGEPDSSAGIFLANIKKQLEVRFGVDAKQYIIGNKKCIAKAICLVLAMGIIPFIFTAPTAIFINLHFAAFALVFGAISSKALYKILSWLILVAFYSMFWFSILGSFGDYICQILYVLSILGLSFYMYLIKNVTPQGKALFDQLNGFKKYIKTAEINRIAASNPEDAQKIFCDYLPYAFAFGLSNKWMDKFNYILSKQDMEKCLVSAGGAYFVSRGLSGAINSSMVSAHGRGGGGFSGGGHGGGGGGGR